MFYSAINAPSQGEIRNFAAQNLYIMMMMKNKMMALVSAGALLLAIAGYAYTTYSSDCCATGAATTEKACCAAPGAGTATAAASMDINPVSSTDGKTMTEEELKACAEAHGMSVEECRKMCGDKGQEAAASCEKGKSSGSCCKK